MTKSPGSSTAFLPVPVFTTERLCSQPPGPVYAWIELAALRGINLLEIAPALSARRAEAVREKATDTAVAVHAAERAQHRFAEVRASLLTDLGDVPWVVDLDASMLVGAVPGAVGRDAQPLAARGEGKLFAH